MKSNPTLQNNIIKLASPAQKVWYAAHVLLAACTSSPAILVRPAVAAVIGKRAVPGYAGFSGGLAESAAQNTTGYAIGEVFPGRPAVVGIPANDGYAAVVGIPALPPSPAYPAGVAIAAVPAVPARAAQIATPAVLPVAAVSSPAVVAIKGYEDAITITQSETLCTVVAELPVYEGVGIVGSNLLKIGEITPAALMATAWVDSIATGAQLIRDIPGETLEQYFYRYALECNHTITEILRNVNGVMTKCLRVAVNVYPSNTFNATLDSLQLPYIFVIPNPGS